MSDFYLIFVNGKIRILMKTKNIIHFLNELKENNNREWFAEHKAWYNEVLLDFEQISTALVVEISKFDEDIKQVEVKDCIFRIYRDTRFSHDKTPYKTHFGVFIATAGGRKSQRAGYYIHLDPAGSFVASGVWCPDTILLKALRQSVYDNIEEFNGIRNQPDFSKYFNTLFEEDKLKTVPRGFPKDFKFSELLKLKHYLVKYDLSPAFLQSDDFVSQLSDILKQAHPFNLFLNYTVDEVINA
jgi:uncharacterized protein (TIGR02453 family)